MIDACPAARIDSECGHAQSPPSRAVINGKNHQRRSCTTVFDRSSRRAVTHRRADEMRQAMTTLISLSLSLSVLDQLYTAAMCSVASIGFSGHAIFVAPLPKRALAIVWESLGS